MSGPRLRRTHSVNTVTEANEKLKKERLQQPDRPWVSGVSVYFAVIETGRDLGVGYLTSGLVFTFRLHESRPAGCHAVCSHAWSDHVVVLMYSMPNPSTCEKKNTNTKAGGAGGTFCPSPTRAHWPVLLVDSRPSRFIFSYLERMHTCIYACTIQDWKLGKY